MEWNIQIMIQKVKNIPSCIPKISRINIVLCFVTSVSTDVVLSASSIVAGCSLIHPPQACCN